MKGTAVASFVVFSAAFAVVLAATLRGGGLDDAFITYTFARNLAAGNGLVWSPGQPAVYGFSTILHVLVLAAAGRAGLDIPTTSLVLGGLGWAAAAALLFEWVRRDLGLLRAVAVSALNVVSLRAVNLSLGMETGVYVFLVIAMLRACVAGRPTLAGVAAGLACLARPDGVLAAVLAALVLIRPRGGAGARIVRFSAAAAAFLLPAAVFVHHTFGTIVPQTVAAKRHGFATTDPFGPRGLVYWLGDSGRDGTTLGAVLLVAGAALGLLRVARSRPWRGTDLLLGWGAVYFAVFWAGRPPEAWWYYAALVPMLHLAFVMGVLGRAGNDAGAVAGPAHLIRRIATAAGVTAMAALLLVTARGTWRQIIADPLGAGGAASEDHRVLAEAIRADLAHRGSATVLAYEVGHLGYLVPGRVDDMLGLVSPELLREGPVDGALTLLRRAPDYVVLNSDMHYRPIAAVAQAPEMVSGYEQIMSRPASGGARHLLFRRRPQPQEVIALPFSGPVAVPAAGARLPLPSVGSRVSAICLAYQADGPGAFDAVVESNGRAVPGSDLVLLVERGAGTRCGRLPVPAPVEALVFPRQVDRPAAAVIGIGVMLAPRDTAVEASLRCLDSGDGRVKGLRPYSTDQGLDFVRVEESRLLAHPPSGVVLGITLGGRGGTLRFSPALDKNTPRHSTDGVTFKIYVAGVRVFEEHVLPAPDYAAREVALPAGSVEVALLTLPGPRGNVGSDWALWDDLAVVVDGAEHPIGWDCQR